MADTPGKGASLRLVLAASRFALPLARLVVRRRLKRGKEDPKRYHERFGVPSLPRTGRQLVWFHAVGVGELLAVSGLIRALGERFPEMQVLLTSVSRTSADAIVANLPAQGCHQYLPLDCAQCIRSFLDHWRPDVSVWVERDIWPAMICELDNRRIPLLLINGRMDAQSYRAKTWMRGMYSNLYRRFRLVGAQDQASADRYRALGVDDERIWVSGSLKAGAAPLADRPDDRAAFEKALAHRKLWLAASTHAADEEAVADAHARILNSDPSTLLVIAPRDPRRADDVEAIMQRHGLACMRLTDGIPPPDDCQVAIIDKIGRLGVWYRVSEIGFIGGSLGKGGGHNPYEPARLGCAVIHGPAVQNFKADYELFHQHRAARLVTNGRDLAEAVLDPEVRQMARNVEPTMAKGASIIDATVDRISRYLKQSD